MIVVLVLVVVVVVPVTPPSRSLSMLPRDSIWAQRSNGESTGRLSATSVCILGVLDGVLCMLCVVCAPQRRVCELGVFLGEDPQGVES